MNDPMYQLVLCLLRLRTSWGKTFCLITVCLAGKVTASEEFTLDPICQSVESRNPILPPGNPAPSTRRMAQLLQHFYENASLQGSVYRSDRLVALIETQLTNTTDINQKCELEFKLALEQMQAGRPDKALNTIAAVERTVAVNGGHMDRQLRAAVRMRKAMAFLRLGEQENCLAVHNADSCLFPLKPQAYHLLPRGSRGAIALFNQQLADSPNDLGARWLLNLAHMTLGEYPEKVPSQFLIPPETFASEYPMPRFVDVSEGLGLDAPDLAGGVIIDDFDNDGLYDVVFSAWDPQGQLRYFHNNGNGTFTERTSEAGLVGETGALNIQQTDYNNDGLLDIWMLRGGWIGKGGRLPSSLLRNNGDGTFTDVTEEAGLMRLHPSQTARWFDYDGDGWLDLFIGNESTDPNDPDWCELYHNNRNGTFTECARTSGINVAAFVKGVACGDYDNDGRPDLYLSVRDGKNILLHNDGPDASGQWHFSDVTDRSGPVGEPIWSFGTFFFDYDNDGWEDLLVFGYRLPNGVADIAADYLGLPNEGVKPKLFHNNHNGTFSDVTEAMHLNRICLTMGNNYGDLDNDGWLDFYCGTGDPDFRTLVPKRMFRNAEGKSFQDVTTATGTGHIQKGHGIAFADLDDDGDQDIYISLGGAYTGDGARNALYLNPGNTNHWLKLKLVGIKANRPAIGARVHVSAKTPKGPRDIYRVVSSGGSFGSNPLRQEIGLGDATSITSVEIRWPGSETRQTLTGLELDHSYQFREGDPVPSILKLHPVKLDHRVTTHVATTPAGP
ncbi:MAG TPA: CRTAC1 family protein [Candidatus Limnocylindrales bacterium]|nr:CRTAC1 family protein [Candidatus Limnocylindrales bacterium]